MAARVRSGAAQVKARLKREQKVLDMCEALFVPGGVEIEVLEEATKYLSQDDYRGVVKERSVRGLCGYPVCSRSVSGEHGDLGPVRLLLHAQKETKRGLSAKGRKHYCSNGCVKSGARLCLSTHTHTHTHMHALAPAHPH